MFAKVVFSQFLRNGLNHCPRVVSGQQEQLPFLSSYCHCLRGSTKNELLDPFSLVSDEVLILANRLRAMVVAEVPKLSSAAGYFFKIGVEGKRVCPTVLLLMASVLNMSMPKLAPDGVNDTSLNELRKRHWCIAEISELIHVTSLIHDDVLDDAETRRGIGSLNFVMGNKLSVLAGNFLLSKAFVVLASLKNTEVVTLLATAVEDLVRGEIMQMASTPEQRCRDWHII